ncbi:efflux transporter outer membrane subunit [Curvibacter sp. HBC61]|uniref:Efflux transporter outer membrane subunit n=1 Tax=Curvibacter cyanobacteriorum TaxID=3026422 RepID=A0ABT5N362_9BURK|nr:efflux transporter outer membrane subunit [Curvibacter sp. HBC61]MDD0840700.1 efflux transporter outer membrane subunit [Curvibacter sp. HBC61]
MTEPTLRRPANRPARPALLTALALPVLLAACSLIPTYHRPAAPLPEQWPGQSSATPGERSAAEAAQLAQWTDYFSDPSLQHLIRTALQNNRDLRVTALNIEQARAQFQISRSKQWPALNAVGGGSHVPMSFGDGRVLQVSSYTAGLAVTSFELDFFGRVASLKEQALAQYLGTEQAHESARLSLIANVATGWLTVLMDEAQLRLSREGLRNLEATQQLIQRSVEHGIQTQQALQQAVAQTQAARATLAQSEQQRQTDENALQLLLGGFQPVPLQPWLEATALGTLQFADLAPGLPSTLLQRRPDIAQAEQSLIAANANIGAARAAFFPTISLTAGVGSMSSQLSGLLKTGSQTYTLSPQLNLPLFNAGQTQANLDAAKVSREIAVAQYEKAIQTAFREVADALAGRSSALAQLAAYQAQSQATQTQLTLSTQGLAAGVNSRLDWLSAERTWLDSRQRLLQARLGRLQNQVALYQALGGSWQASGAAATAAASPAEPSAGL